MKSSMYRSGSSIIRCTSSGRVATLLNRADHGRTDGDVRDEMAVHDVDVNEIRAAALDRGDVAAEIGEICRQD